MVCVFFFSLCFVSPHGNVLTNHTQALVALQMFSQWRRKSSVSQIKDNFIANLPSRPTKEMMRPCSAVIKAADCHFI